MPHLEGKQSVTAALKARQRKFDVVLISHGAHEDKLAEVFQCAQDSGVPIRRVDSKELDSIAHGSSHGGVVAICTAKPRTTVDQLLDLIHQLREPPLLLLLEGVDDARNLGFTLRSAEALGAHAVLIKKHLWDFDETEVARPASGAYERIPMVQIDDLDLLLKLQRNGVKIYGCIAGAKRLIYHGKLDGPCILAIGGEKRGLSGAVRGICDQFLTIPLKGEATSLSLSHAAAIVLGEAMRQRADVKPFIE